MAIGVPQIVMGVITPIQNKVNSLTAEFRRAKNVGFINYMQGQAEELIEDAAPRIRSVYAAFAYLERPSIGKVGAFVPELYELAKMDELQCQREAKAWFQAHPGGNLQTGNLALYNKLHGRFGRPKNAVELAIIPSLDVNDITRAISEEYSYRCENKLELPVFVPKIGLREKYFSKLSGSGFAIAKHKGVDIDGQFLNYVNPHEHASTREKLLHFFTSWNALLKALLTAVTMIGLEGHITPLALLGAGAVYLANIHGNYFGQFDVAENLNREIGVWQHMLPTWKGKEFSFKKTMWALLQLAGIVVGAGIAASAAWIGTFALPWVLLSPAMSMTAVLTGASAATFLLESLQLGSAVFLATATAISTATGIFVTQRFFWDFTFWDKNIPKAELEAAARQVVPLPEEPRMQPVAQPSPLQKKFNEMEQGLQPMYQTIKEFGLEKRLDVAELVEAAVTAFVESPFKMNLLQRAHLKLHPDADKPQDQDKQRKGPAWRQVS